MFQLGGGGVADLIPYVYSARMLHGEYVFIIDIHNTDRKECKQQQTYIILLPYLYSRKNMMDVTLAK